MSTQIQSVPREESHLSPPLPPSMNTEAAVPTATPLGSPTSQVDPTTSFWSAYNGAADIEDKVFVKASGGDLDALLIFAGLFSAINTAFIIEAYKGLKADPVEETNKLLRSLILATQNPSSFVATIDGEKFTPTTRDIRVNICFFISLCCSLCAAFGAVLAKQWLTQYDGEGGVLKPPSERGRERQTKYEGLNHWGLEHVVVTLPTLLQFSLFFFLAGLVSLVEPLDSSLEYIVTTFTALTFLFWLVTILISTTFPSAPFQTRLSRLLRQLCGSLVGALALDSWVDSRCVAYLLERKTLLSELDVLAHVLDSLPGSVDAATVMKTLITFHLKPSREEHLRLHGLHGPTQKPLLKILHILFVKWKYLTEGVNTSIKSYPPLNSRPFLYSLRPELAELSLMNPEDQESHGLVMEILLALPAPPFEDRADPDSEWTAAIKSLEDCVSTRLRGDRNSVLQERSLALLASSFNPSRTFEVIKSNLQVSSGIQRFLFSTTWSGSPKKVNLDGFWMGILRVQILPVYPPQPLLGSGFAEYLAVWFKANGMPERGELGAYNHAAEQDQEKHQWVYWSYLFALNRLLERNGSTREWSEELRNHDHVSCLQIVLQNFPKESPFLGAPLALRFLLRLWGHPAPEGGLHQSARPQPTEEHLRMVAGAITSGDTNAISAVTLRPYGPILFVETDTVIDDQLSKKIAETAKWLDGYLKAARPQVEDMSTLETIDKALLCLHGWGGEPKQSEDLAQAPSNNGISKRGE